MRYGILKRDEEGPDKLLLESTCLSVGPTEFLLQLSQLPMDGWIDVWGFI